LNTRYGSVLGLGALWLFLLLLSLLTRPLLPVDETRYVAVAWEMWQRGDFLVPFLNGAPYSHKPPLFFWLVHAGWALFGVNEWWPRSVGALASLAALLLTAQLARRLWPEDRRAARCVPWVLFGSVFWTTFFTWTQIDMLLVLCALMGVTGVAAAARGRPAGWLLAGVAIGVGVLAKGPVILVYVLPPALLAPLWKGRETPHWWRWYAGVAASLVIGSAIALGWAWPAAQAGGEAYGQAILWGQTAGRVTHSFAHAHPWWWYLPWLPVVFAPWCLFPAAWRRLLAAWQGAPDPGLRLCVVWLVSVILILSLVSGKQAKYLLPLLPVFALLVARSLSQAGRDATLHPRLLAALLFLAGAVLAVLPVFSGLPAWLGTAHPLWGVLLMSGGLVLGFVPRGRLTGHPALVAMLPVLVLTVVHLGYFPTAVPAYDLRAVSRLLGEAQAGGHAVANLATYHGQYHFYGRLKAPVAEITPAEAGQWSARHPGGYLLAYYRKEGLRPAGAIAAQDYRSGSLVLWRGSAIVADPGLLP